MLVHQRVFWATEHGDVGWTQDDVWMKFHGDLMILNELRTSVDASVAFFFIWKRMKTGEFMELANKHGGFIVISWWFNGDSAMDVGIAVFFLTHFRTFGSSLMFQSQAFILVRAKNPPQFLVYWCLIHVREKS